MSAHLPHLSLSPETFDGSLAVFDFLPGEIRAGFLPGREGRRQTQSGKCSFNIDGAYETIRALTESWKAKSPEEALTTSRGCFPKLEYHNSTPKIPL